MHVYMYSSALTLEGTCGGEKSMLGVLGCSSIHMLRQGFQLNDKHAVSDRLGDQRLTGPHGLHINPMVSATHHCFWIGSVGESKLSSNALIATTLPTMPSP